MVDLAGLTTVTYAVDDHGVATLTLNRPEALNSFTETMCDEVAAVWRSARVDPAVRCVVLTGTGNRAFCTGIDRSQLDGAAPYDGLTYDDPGRRLGARSHECWKPIIAAVNGMACGGAFYLLGDADVIIAADHATFFDPHVTYGMPAVYEPILLAHRMFAGDLARMMLTGAHERLSASRAREVGLVSEVVPADSLLDVAQQLARTIAGHPPVAVQTTVRTLWAARSLGRSQMLEAGNALLAMGYAPSERSGGQDSFNSGVRISPRIL